MLNKLITLVMLVGATGLVGLANFQYLNIHLDKLQYSFTAIATAYLFLKLLLEEIIAKRIEDQKSRCTLRKTTQLLFVFVAFFVILRI